MAIYKSIFNTLERLRKKRQERAEELYVQRLHKLPFNEVMAILDRDIEEITQEILELEAARGVTDEDRQQDPHWKEIWALEKEIAELRAEETTAQPTEE